MRCILGICLALVVVAGCSGTGASAPTGTLVATALPAVTAPTSTAATPTATPTPAPSATAATPIATDAPPPQAEIVIAGSATPGDLGSYVIDDRGSDGPWLPFATLPAVHAAATEPLTVRFVDRVPIGEFDAVIAGAADTSGSSPQGVQAAATSGDAASLTVGPLPAGKWVLSVRLFRADGRGDGTTYWAVTVG
jgi:hypothetical protein